MTPGLCWGIEGVYVSDVSQWTELIWQLHYSFMMLLCFSNASSDQNWHAVLRWNGEMLLEDKELLSYLPLRNRTRGADIYQGCSWWPGDTDNGSHILSEDVLCRSSSVFTKRREEVFSALVPTERHSICLFRTFNTLHYNALSVLHDWQLNSFSQLELLGLGPSPVSFIIFLGRTKWCWSPELKLNCMFVFSYYRRICFANYISCALLRNKKIFT